MNFGVAIMSDMQVTPGYSGDILPAETWQRLNDDPGAVLIDVRTEAEWAFVGTPDLSQIENRLLLVAWQDYPEMGRNPGFVAQISEQVPDRATTLLFICRSGQRSRFAAIAMTEAGYQNCFNVAEGFEGDSDGDRHRGQTGGWKVASLPWVQN